jgi:hypothetical protein
MPRRDNHQTVVMIANPATRPPFSPGSSKVPDQAAGKEYQRADGENGRTGGKVVAEISGADRLRRLRGWREWRKGGTFPTLVAPTRMGHEP